MTTHTEETISSAVARMSAYGRIRHPFCGTSIVPFDAHGLGRPKAPAAPPDAPAQRALRTGHSKIAGSTLFRRWFVDSQYARA
jgi:hypothetical protein